MELAPHIKAFVLDGVICYQIKYNAYLHKRVICLCILSTKASLHNGHILHTTQHAGYIRTLSLYLLCFMWICALNTVLLLHGPSTRQLDDARGGRTCLKEVFKNYCRHLPARHLPTQKLSPSNLNLRNMDIFNYMKPIVVVQSVTLLTCVEHVHGSTLSRNVGDLESGFL